MHMEIFVPRSYSELTAAQSRWMFRTLAKNPELNSVEFKTFAFLRFAGLHVITKDYESGGFLIKLGRSIFRIDAAQIAGAIRHLDWTLFPPARPWRPDRIAWRRPTDADFSDVDFKTYIAVDNLYQGYLQTYDLGLIRRIADMLVPSPHRPFREWELAAVFHWIASVKDFFVKKFPHFFSPADSNSLAGSGTLPSHKQIEDAMNAQIRALTKGDISREEEILSMPCWRALVELDSQAREYQELKAKTK